MWQEVAAAAAMVWLMILSLAPFVCLGLGSESAMQAVIHAQWVTAGAFAALLLWALWSGRGDDGEKLGG